MKTKFKLIIPVVCLLLSCSKETKEKIEVIDEYVNTMTDEKVYHTLIAGITVPFSLPKGKPKYLAVYLHGDGSNRIAHDGLHKEIEFARKHNVVFIAPWANKTKVSTSTGKEILSWAKVQDADGLSEVIERFCDQYNLPRDTILFETVSGGSWYITNEFIHRVGNVYQGPMLINCGADKPSGKFMWDPKKDTQARDKIHMNYVYGSGDFLVPSINKSIAAYKEQGFKITTPNPLTDVGHCGIWGSPLAVKMWEKHITQK